MSDRVAVLRRWLYAASDEAAAEAVLELASLGLGPVPDPDEGEYTPDGWEQVAPEWACPWCQERDMDSLLWLPQGDRVYCGSCGATYVPGRGRHG